jgi:hypothetical protein
MIPLPHDVERIGRVDFKEWKGDIEQWMDMDNMFKPGTDPVKKDEVLRGVYDTQRTDGAINIDPDAPKSVLDKKFGLSKHQLHRVLQPKDGDSWMAYAAKYGNQEEQYGKTIMSYIEDMGKTIGAAEYWGSNPDAAFESVIKEFQRLGLNKDIGKAAANTYAEYMGRNAAQDTKIGDLMKGLRAVEASAKLAYAPISATADISLTGITGIINSLDNVKLLKRFMGNLSGVTWKEQKLQANRFMLNAEYALSKGAVANRYADVTGSGKMAKITDFLIRAGGLHHWTVSLRASFGLEFLSNMGSLAGKNWDEIPGNLKTQFSKYGIQKDSWSTIRKATVLEKDVPYVDPSMIENTDLMYRVTAMIKRETDFAVPEPTARTRAIVTQGTQGGTVAGEFMRNMGQFGSFPITYMQTHGQRGLAMSGYKPLAYFGSIAATSTTLGLGIVWTKDILKGNDPRKLDWVTLGDAFAAGGVGGLYTQFLLRDPNGIGGWVDVLGGAVAGDIARAASIPFMTMKDMYDGQRKVLERTAGRSIDLLRQITPATWYTKTLADKLLIDNLQMSVDPEWRNKQRRIKNRLRERGQRQFVKPGAKSIRAPKTPKVEF